MRKPSWQRPAHILLTVSIFIAAFWVYRAEASRIGFQGDESRYIWRARYFQYLFVDHDVTRSEWGDNHSTHTQPMLTNYLIGGWLWLRGYDLERLMSRYDWSKSWGENLRAGQVPGWTVLAEARTPPVLFAAGTVTLLYLLGSALGGPVAGLMAAVLALGSPLLRVHLSQVRSESPMTLLLVLGLLVALLGARRGHDGRLPLRWALALGLTLGLGFATKLTAVLSLAALVVWAALVALAAIWRNGSATPRAWLAQAWVAGRGWVLALVVALGVFVVVNPHLYADPFKHTAHLFEKRAQEMQEQKKRLPALAVDNPADRPAWVLGGSFRRETITGTQGLMLEALLGAAGVAVLLRSTWRGWRRTAQLPAEGLVLLTIVIYFAGISAGLSLGYARYLIPTVLLGNLLSGLGSSGLAAWAVGLPNLIRRHPPGVRVAAHPTRPRP